MVKPVPFDFVFDYLPAGIVAKKMFGMHYLYFGKRIMLILRQGAKRPDLNGIWVATETIHHKSLMSIIPALTFFHMNSDGQPSGWLFLQDSAGDFEEAAIELCKLISHGDPRIGRATEKAPLS